MGGTNLTSQPPRPCLYECRHSFIYVQPRVLNDKNAKWGPNGAETRQDHIPTGWMARPPPTLCWRTSQGLHAPHENHSSVRATALGKEKSPGRTSVAD